jgi:hypothetical protein
LQRGAGGISGESFQKVKVSFFKELKCYGIFTSFFPFRIPQSAFRIQIARPVQEMRCALVFARNALASGPQACFFAEKPIAKMKGGQPLKTP